MSTVQPTTGSGEASYVSSPTGVRGRSPVGNGFLVHSELPYSDNIVTDIDYCKDKTISVLVKTL